ncbi:MAG: right-handed parallel beta-helix repeat-containing protein [Planctomycetota bacterium]
MNLKNYTPITILLFYIIFINTSITFAHSVYVTSDTQTSHLQSYKIDGTNLIYQVSYMCQLDPPNDAGAVAIAIDDSEYGDFLFVTFENEDEIELVNAKTMQYADKVTAPGADDLAGIAMDSGKSKLYAVDRYTNHLFSWSWSPVTKKLIPDFNAPYYIELEYLEWNGYSIGAFGIALDEENGLLYVADNTDEIKYYDTNDWSKIGEVNNVSCNVISIAIDVNNQLLYYGSMGYYGEGDPNLYQYDISAQNEISVTVGASVAGIAVDQQTSLVYLTTFGGQFGTNEPYPKDRLFVFDANLTEQWVSDDIGNPAGVAVAGNVSYKPPFPLVTLVKDDNDVCVSPLISEAQHELMGTPYNWLYYTIDCNANGHADTNVFITDHLPAEVNYISSSLDPNGVYDPCKHTVTWEIPVMSASYSNTFWIQVGVNYYAKPGHKIMNLCEIESDLYYMFTTLETDVCCYGVNIIYVDADANDPNSYHNGTSWLHAYKDLQEALHTARTCGREQIWVAQQTYKPTDINDTSARPISFELVNNVALYGGFPPGGGTWTQRNLNVYETILSGDIAAPDYQSDNSYHVVKCQDVNNAILDGFIITAGNADALGSTNPNQYGGGIYCKDSNGLIVRNCSISINSAKYGGGMYNEFSSANITNCIFFDNEATYDNGGAIYITNSSEPNVTNCIFSNNSARKGGAVYNNYSEPNITNCVFIGNTADYYGGSMFNSDESSPTIINCTFSGNSATTMGNSYGGAICNWNFSDPNVTNCTFIDNSAHEGGAVYNYYDSDPNIANCIFTANDADMGGGLYISSSSPDITNCIFVGNTADSYGGGMYNYNESYPVVVNSIFSGNRADIYGGGIASYINTSLALTNCTVSGNSAYSGGGIWSWSYADTNITNCILWANEANSVDEIFIDDPNTVIISYSDIEDSNGSGDNWVDEIGTDGGYNIDEDPCFFSVEPSTGSWSENAAYDSSTFQSTLTDTDANWAVNELAGKFVSPNTPQLLQFFIVSNNVNTIKVWSDVNDIAKATRTYQIYDYHLTTDSACIDTGYPDGDYNGQTDIDGELRVFDGDYNDVPIIDMGADEYYWSPADFDSDGFVNFFDYAFFASAWLTTPNDVNYYDDIYDLVDNNYIDSNDLARFCEDWLWQTAWAKAFPFSYGRGMGKSMGMGEGFFPSIEAKQARPQLTATDIEQMIKWLAELWLTDDQVRKMITEKEWLKFIESVKQVTK